MSWHLIRKQQKNDNNTEEVDNGGEYLNTKEWDDIALGSEHEKCILATNDKKKKNPKYSGKVQD